MKKILKKIGGLLVCVSLIASLAACGGSGDNVSGEAEAREVVENFMDAFCDLEFSKLSDYVINENSELSEFDFDALIEEEFTSSLAGSGMEAYAEDFRPIIDKYLDAISSNMKYEISDVEKDGSDYIVTVDFETFEFKTLINAMDTIDSSQGEALAMELLESGKITEDMTEEEMMKVLMEGVVEFMADAIDDAVASAEPRSTVLSMVVSEKDGKWLIDDEKGDASGLEEIFSF